MASCGKKLVRSKSGLKMVASSQATTSPFCAVEPPWIPDSECKYCIICQQKFDILRRRHHCRRCGRVFCSSCCNGKMALPRMCFIDPVRQCDSCLQVTVRENEFFDKHLKILMTGGQFILTSSVIGSEATSMCLCKLATDNRFLKFEFCSNTTELEPAEVETIHTLNILTSGCDPQGNQVATSIELHYRDDSSEDQHVQLTVPEGALKKQAMMWIVALRRGMKIMKESESDGT